MNITKALKKLILGAAVISTTYGVLPAQAQQTLNETITMTVQDAFTLAVTVPMHFGSVVAITKATGTPAQLVLTNAGVATYGGSTGNARFVSADPALLKALTYTIAGAAASAIMAVDYGAPVTLSCDTATTPACAGGGTFTLDTFVDDHGNTGTGTITTALGAATVKVGATLSTVNSATQYKDGNYIGTWTINVNY